MQSGLLMVRDAFAAVTLPAAKHAPVIYISRSIAKPLSAAVMSNRRDDIRGVEHEELLLAKLRSLLGGNLHVRGVART